MDNKTKFQGNSIGLWATGFSTEHKINVHINFWHFAKCDDHLEIGIEFGSIAFTEDFKGTVCIYLPLDLEEHSHITDLGNKFAERKVATSIFNKGLEVTADASPLITLTSEKKDTDKRFVYCFSQATSNGTEISSEELECSKYKGGTVLKITEKAFERATSYLKSKEGKIYFRIRIALPNSQSGKLSRFVPLLPPERPFVKKINPIDGWLNSGYEAIEYIDFRLNDVRNLPDSIAREISAKTNLIKIKTVYFLLAAEIAIDVVSGHKDFHKSRMLERGIWDKYIGRKSEKSSQMVVYHWKEPRNDVCNYPAACKTDDCKTGINLGSGTPDTDYLENFSAFVKMRIRRSSLKTIIIFFSFILLTSWIANQVPDWCDDTNCFLGIDKSTLLYSILFLCIMVWSVYKSVGFICNFLRSRQK